jgi:uracil-DNA glycosylase
VTATTAPEAESVPTRLHPSWRAVLGDQLRQPYFRELDAFLEAERSQHTVYPPKPDVFNAFKLTAYDDVKLVVLGQDPYHGEGQAHGLAFSVRPGVKPPPSLRNIFRELRSDLGCPQPKNGSLEPWAQQGVLLLNAVLTVRAGQPNSHRGKGWERFTDAAIAAVETRAEPAVFVLWGGPAQKKQLLIDAGRHTVLKAPHPSPLSAKSGFFGSRPFSAANAALEAVGLEPIDWCLPAD